MIIVEGLENKDKTGTKLGEQIREWRRCLDLEIEWMSLFEMDLIM
jgi:hypothetical protein